MPTSENLTSATSGDAERKAFATLQARFAIAGYTLSRADRQNGASVLYASRWGAVRELRDLEAAEAWFQAAAGKAHA